MSTHRTEAPASAAELEARVAAELRALGEPELGPDELAATPTAAVLAAFTLAYPPAIDRSPSHDDVALGELAQHRVWRKVAARAIAPATAAPRPAARGLRATWIAVATAAGIALVPMLGARIAAAPVAGGDRAALELVREQARGAVEGLPGSRDQVRAREYADRYAEQLRGEGAVR